MIPYEDLAAALAGHQIARPPRAPQPAAHDALEDPTFNSVEAGDVSAELDVGDFAEDDE